MTRLRPVGLVASALAVAAALLATAVALRTAANVGRYMHPERRAASRHAGEGDLAGFSDVALRTADGLELSAWWRPPANGAAVVLLHGMGANREQLLPQALGLARRGYGVLLLDLRGHGASGGEGSTLGDQERLDAAAGIAFAAGAPGVRPGAVAVVGFSIGGLAVAGAALQDPRVGAVVLEGTHPSLEQMLLEEFDAHGRVSGVAAVWSARARGVHVDAVRPIDALCGRRVRPLLLVYGELDEDAPPRHGDALRRAACGDAGFTVVPGGRHGAWDRRAGAAIDAAMGAFLDAALRPAPER